MTIKAHPHEDYSGLLNALAFSPDGGRLASAGWNVEGDNYGGFTLWDARSGQEVRKLPTTGQQITALAFSPDGQWLAGGGGQDPVQLSGCGQGNRGACLRRPAVQPLRGRL